MSFACAATTLARVGILLELQGSRVRGSHGTAAAVPIHDALISC
jgi:hypothetical protein